MITTFQAIIIGLLQGITELFPISSLGHSVILPQLVGWDINQNDPYFLNFLVATHLATAIVLFWVFRRDWLKIIKDVAAPLAKGKVDTSTAHAKIGWLLIVGTIPAGLIGLIFEDSFHRFFKSAQYAAFFLLLNGFVLLLAEHLRSNNQKARLNTQESDKEISKLKWSEALFIGTSQASALFPGISRSGASMAGGLLSGLNNESAARFSFLLATPIIGAAAVLKIPELFSDSAHPERGAIFIGALCAALSAYVSVKFLLKYFQTNTLKPFAVYCLIAGATTSIYFWLN